MSVSIIPYLDQSAVDLIFQKAANRAQREREAAEALKAAQEAAASAAANAARNANSGFSDALSSAGSNSPASSYDAGKYEEYFKEAADTFGVSVELLKSIAKTESNFNPRAVSRAGAMGIMQLMPSTAATLGVSNPYDAKENIMAGSSMIASLISKYNGNLSLALAAYNAGSGNVEKYGGIPPFAETQNYVKKVLSGIGVDSSSAAQYQLTAASAAASETEESDDTAEKAIHVTDRAPKQMTMRVLSFRNTTAEETDEPLAESISEERAFESLTSFISSSFEPLPTEETEAKLIDTNFYMVRTEAAEALSEAAVDEVTEVQQAEEPSSETISYKVAAEDTTEAQETEEPSIEAASYKTTPEETEEPFMDSASLTEAFAGLLETETESSAAGSHGTVIMSLLNALKDSKLSGIFDLTGEERDKVNRMLGDFFKAHNITKEYLDNMLSLLKQAKLDQQS